MNTNTTQASDISKRIAKINTLNFAYDDAVYDLLADVVVAPYLGQLNSLFNKTHSISMRGGAGPTGSDTSALVVSIPREKKEGFWNKVQRIFSSQKQVMRITLRGERWQCDFQDEYWEFAEAMKSDYKQLLEPGLFGR